MTLHRQLAAATCSLLLVLLVACATGSAASSTPDAREVTDAAFEAGSRDAPDTTPADAIGPDVRGEVADVLPDAGEVGPETTPAATPFKVMSFNLRTGFADDGADSWTPRKAIVTHFLQAEAPDLVGVQEALIFQLTVVSQALPDHDWVGTDRTGTKLDEFSAIFYDRLRFELVDSGTFWLSDTPDVVGSKFSDKQLFPRIVTWAHLTERATGRELFHANTHVDTTDADNVPERSCALIVQKIAELAAGKPVVVTGDFNTFVDDPAYQILVGDAEWEGTTGALLDPWRELTLPEEGSFHGFDGAANDDRRIDWILHTSDLETLEAVVSHFNENDHYPSDHFPVWARLRPAAAR